MSLGQNIYKLRTGKRLSQEDFAAAMEVSRQSVSKWENDMAVPELEKLIKMAKLFEMSLDELVGNTTPAPKPVQSPEPAPAPGLTTGDLISVVLLLLGILIPPATFFFDLSLLMIVLLILPPLFTWIATFCSPTNQTLFKVYGIYNSITLIITVMFTGLFGILFVLEYIAVMLHWLTKLK